MPLPFPEPALSTPPLEVPVETARKQTARVWAAVHLSALPLEALGVSETSEEEVVAVVESWSPKALILVASAGAQLAGIEVGMMAAEACARVGSLQLKLRDTEREMAALDRLAAWSKRFTSVVSLEPPETLLLEVGGSQKLFGDLETLQTRIREGFDAQGYTANVASAPTPRAALWLARAGSGQVLNQADQIPSALGELPLSTLALSRRNACRFKQLGINTIRQAFRLPRDGLTRRFGAELLCDWDRALGQAPEPRRRWESQSRFAAERELPDAYRDLNLIAPVIDDLVEELTTTLTRHNAGIDTLVLLFRHDKQPPTRCVLNLLTASRDTERIRRLLRTRLEQFALPAPVISVRLVSDEFKSIAPSRAELFGQTTPSSPADALIEALCTRLGRQAVCGLTSVADHRPEYAWREVAPGKSTAVSEAQNHDSTAPRPFWLLAVPEPMEECGGRPQHWGKALQIKGPPERIEGGWWEAGDMGRDYYRARTQDGAWLWVYREHRGARRWFLHGYFA